MRLPALFLLAILLAISSFALSNKDKELLTAAGRGDTEKVRATLAAGADVEVRDKNGRTPLMLAAQRGDLEILRLVLAKGAKQDLRDKNGLTAYGLALLLPSGRREPVLALLTKPPLLRIAADAAWVPESMTSSCYLSRPELAQNIERLHLDALTVGAYADYARINGKDTVDIVRADAEGLRSSASEIDASDTGADAVLELAVRPGVFCSGDADKIYLAIDVSLLRAGQKAPIWKKTFGGGLRGLHTRNVNTPSQYPKYFEGWARDQVDSIYWESLRELVRQTEPGK